MEAIVLFSLSILILIALAIAFFHVRAVETEVNELRKKIYALITQRKLDQARIARYEARIQSLLAQRMRQ